MFKHRQEVYTKLDDLGGNVFTHDKMIEWATSFFNKANKLSSVSSNKAHEAVRLAKVGVGNRGQTAYDMFNGVTELLTHGDRSGKEKTFRSSEFGTHAKYKADALESLHNPTAVADHIERGSRLLTYGELV